MALSREDLDKLIKELPEEKYKLLSEYAERLYKESKEKSVLDERAMKYLFDNYDDTLKGLVQR